MIVLCAHGLPRFNFNSWPRDARRISEYIAVAKEPLTCSPKIAHNRIRFRIEEEAEDVEEQA